jgi:hypothetical protein
LTNFQIDVGQRVDETEVFFDIDHPQSILLCRSLNGIVSHRSVSLIAWGQNWLKPHA